MELDDLKARWEDFDRKLDASLRLNTQIVRVSLIERTERALKRSSFAVLAECLANLLVVWWLGSFMADHVREPRFLIPAAILEAGAMALLALFGQQVVRMRSLDHGRPVLEVQRDLQSLQIRQINLTRWIVFLSPLLWTPLVIVSLKAALGVDAYDAVPGWLVANLLFGLAAIPALAYVSSAFSERWKGTPLLKSIMRDTAGRSLVEAKGFMDELARFEANHATGGN